MLTKEQATQHFGEGWAKELAPLLSSEYFNWLQKTLRGEYLSKQVTPGWSKVFAAFRACPPDKLKVLVLGDRPYKSPQYNGIAFAAPNPIVTPRTIYEIIRHIEESQYGSKLVLDFDPSMQHWVNQGVLCLNSSLTTVVTTKQNDHKDIWYNFTNYMLKYLATFRPDVPVLCIGEGNGFTKELFDNLDVVYIRREHLNNFQANIFGRVNDLLYVREGEEGIIYWDKNNNKIYDLPF